MQKRHKLPLEFHKHSAFSFGKDPALRARQDLCSPNLEKLTVQLQAEAPGERENGVQDLTRLCWWVLSVAPGFEVRL